jgi:hypothetical protein
MRWFAPPSTGVRAAFLGLLTAALPLTARAGPAATRLAPPVLLATGASTNPVTFYNEVPDTGQFLPDSAVVASVDQRKFTAREFVIEYYSAFAADRPKPDSAGRVAFMHALTDKEVLSQTARKVGYNIGYEGRTDMRDYTQRILANALFRRLVVDPSMVTDEEIARAYEQYKTALHLNRILLFDRATAERVRRDLIAGRIGWREAVKKYSRASNDAPPDGGMGWVTRASLSVPLAEQVYAIKPGQISQLVEDETGFQILKLVETKPANPPALYTMRRQIRNQLVGYRVSLNGLAVQNEVAAYMGFVADTANIAYVCKFFPKPVTMDHPETGGATMTVNEALPGFSEADTARILARWKGGSLSLGRFLIEYSTITPISRPSVDTPDGMTSMAINIASEPYKAQMAHERGFDKDPVVVSQLESHYDKLIVTRMYSDSVDIWVHVTPQERRAEFDAHPERYRVPETRRFATILRNSQASGDSLAAALRKGASAAAVLAADSVGRFQSGMIRDQNAEEHGPFKRVVFDELRPGQVEVLAGDRGRVVVVQLLSVTPPRQQIFVEATVAADDNARADKSEKLMKEWLARLRKHHQIEIHPELAMRIRLVDPVAI